MKHIKHQIALIYKAAKVYISDAKHYVRHSLLSGYQTSEEKFLRMITLRAHVVEKGLTMPDMKLNFGEENILLLLDLCFEYLDKKYDTKRTMFLEAVRVLVEYGNVHAKQGVPVHAIIEAGIRRLKEAFPALQAGEQPEVHADELFQRGDFYYVANHRHSVRHFTGHIDMSDVIRALDLARTAPSACNRQPVKVHIIPRSDRFDRLLQLQHGNRGFGSDAEYLLVLTVMEDGYNGIAERNAMYIDGGIFIMNLLYSLQYYSIASCTLNCSFLPDEEKTLASILQTEDVAVAMIAIGSCPDTFRVARSTRIPLDEIIINQSAR